MKTVNNPENQTAMNIEEQKNQIEDSVQAFNEAIEEHESNNPASSAAAAPPHMCIARWENMRLEMNGAVITPSIAEEIADIQRKGDLGDAYIAEIKDEIDRLLLDENEDLFPWICTLNRIKHHFINLRDVGDIRRHIEQQSRQ